MYEYIKLCDYCMKTVLASRMAVSRCTAKTVPAEIRVTDDLCVALELLVTVGQSSLKDIQTVDLSQSTVQWTTT